MEAAVNTSRPFRPRTPQQNALPLTEYELKGVVNRSEQTDTENKEAEELFSGIKESIVNINKTNTEPVFKPINIYPNHENLKTYYDPEEKNLLYVVVLAAASVGFVLLYFFKIYPLVSAYMAAICAILSFIGMIAKQFRHKKTNIPPLPVPKSNTLTVTSSINVEVPSSIFANQPKVSVGNASYQHTMNLYRPYSNADRPSASLQHSQFSANANVSIDQLASEAIRRCGISSALFNKYLANMKAFVQRSLLAKLVPKLHLNDPAVEAMLAVPNFEQHRSYIENRIKKLASSQFLSGHFGDRGERWQDREWTTEYPSDNQIVLHVLAVWLSTLMPGKKETKRIQMLFKENYFYSGKDPRLENEDDVLLCTEDWSAFYVLAKYRTMTPEKFYASPGRDALYGALTIFFYLIKEKHNFLLMGADLTHSPFFMDRVFSKERLQ